MGDGRLSPQERRWLLLWCAGILLVSSIPYLVAWQATPAGHEFAGMLVNPLDGHSYLAKMRQGWLGSWSFQLTYSPEPHQGSFVYVTYLALGHLARAIGLPLAVVYHFARLAAGLAMLIALYRFLSHLTASVTERRLAFLLVALSAGLGWLGAAFGRLPVDLWVPEGFAFFSLLTNPHFPLGLALMLVLLEHVLWPAHGITRWLIPGLAGLFLALVLPFALAAVFVTAGLTAVLRFLADYRSGDRRIGGPATVTSALHAVCPQVEATAAALLFCLPVVIYDAVVFTTNPALSAWSGQNLTPAPLWPDLLLGYGLLLPLAIGGAVVVLHQRDRAGWAILVWAIVTILMVYFPISLQRRLITGLGLPLGMLAALGLSRSLMPWVRRRWLPPLTIFLCAFGNIFLVFVLIMGAKGETTAAKLPQSRLFLSADESAAAGWLRQHAAGSVVLASERLGMFLPGQAGVRVVYGHPFETIGAKEKQEAVDKFFSRRAGPRERQETLSHYGVDYVLLDTADVSPDALGLPAPWAIIFRQGDMVLLAKQ